MTPEQLKLSILQYAIQGKLVQQKLEEGTANDLLMEIKEEKEKLIALGEIPKERKLQMISDEEKEFDIPSNWKYVRVQDIASYITDYVANGSFAILKKNTKTYKTPNYAIFVRTKDLTARFSGECSYIDKESYEFLKKSKLYGGELILPNIGGSIGKTFLMPDLKMPMSLAPNSIMVKFLYPVMNKFFSYIIQSSYGKNFLINTKGGTATPKFSKTQLRNMVIMLPPLKEIERIVAKVEEIFTYIDYYKSSWKKLEQLNIEFPEKMKKSILQYAIQGKLVEQRPEEGNAEELYKCIINDRNKKIKAGLIKKDKRTFLGEIKEIPFDIPDNWKWVTLGSVLLKLTDGTHKTPKYTDHGVKFVSVKDMSSGKLSLEHTKFITEEEHKELFKRCNPQKGDILLSKVGTTGVPAIIDTDEQFSLFVSVALLKYNHKFINEKYLYYLLLSPLVQQQAAENTRGVGNKNWVLDAIGKTMIALPPYQEQIRIVSELEKILPYCEQLI